MDKINIDKEILLENLLVNIQKNINKDDQIINTFIYGNNGVGKTTIVNNVLKKLNYNINEYTIFSYKSKNILEYYEEFNNQHKNIIDIFNNINKTGIILIDNIDLINSIDKNTLNLLIKILRLKKNKKNNNKKCCNNKYKCQIILISNTSDDKKIKEIMKLCNNIEINNPTKSDIYNILQLNHPNVSKVNINNFLSINKNINYYLLEKFNNLQKTNTLDLFIKYSIDNLTNNNVKFINYYLFNNYLDFNDDNNKINEADKTTVSLLFHENIIDYIGNDIKKNIIIYIKLLSNYCFADYIDRNIFQKQLWQLNEISFKIKVIYNNRLFHNYIRNNNLKVNVKLNNIRFTKILTKYSSEFNNYIFILTMCQKFDIDKKDLNLFILNIKKNYTQDNINYIIDKYDLTILDINRLIKLISIISIYD